MPIYEEAPEDTFDPEADVEDGGWREVSRTAGKDGGPDVFSVEAGEATLVGQFPARKRRDALKKLLGIAEADAGSPYKLRRTVPWAHPEFPWLKCVGASFDTTVHAPNDRGDGKFWPRKAALDPARYPRYTTDYRLCTATLKFAPVPWTVFTDAELESEGGGREYNRYTAVFDGVDPVLELLMADTAPFMKFVEGPGAAVDDAVFGGTLAEFLRQADFMMIWRQVPEEYLMADTGYLPARLMHHMGTVNEESFFGCPAGTLRMNPPRLKRYQQQVWTEDAYGSWCYDVWLSFRYTDPPLGPVAVSPETYSVVSPRRRGHRVFPYGRTGTFWAAERADTTNGAARDYLPMTDFGDLFEHVSDPAFPIPRNPP